MSSRVPGATTATATTDALRVREPLELRDADLVSLRFEAATSADS
jgi:hypothetical protein